MPAAERTEDIRLGSEEQPPAHDCQCRCRADGGRHHARLQEVHRQADINKVGLNK